MSSLLLFKVDILAPYLTSDRFVKEVIAFWFNTCLTSPVRILSVLGNFGMFGPQKLELEDQTVRGRPKFLNNKGKFTCTNYL